MKTRVRPKSALRDLIGGDDARVICTEAFQPYMGQAIDRGRFFTLGAPIVRQYPAYFCIAVPVSDVLGEIEKGG
jgi:hypothetical protein